MKKIIVFLYGLFCYLVFFVTFVYTMGFVGNIAVPKSIDAAAGPQKPLTRALIINIVLLALFAVQHSTMARLKFKAWWLKIIPAPMERSTYVLLGSLLLILLFWQWCPIPTVVWNIENNVLKIILTGLSVAGWVMVLISTFMIGHFRLFGLHQAYMYLRGKEYKKSQFKIPGFYRFIRHPIMLGFLILFWATPRMTWGHLLFAIITTAYILVGIQLEERTLITIHGDDYIRYRRQVSMLIPRLSRSK
jgi:protein-S-isoprenylcysteine O-methyltransferase Ste14